MMMTMSVERDARWERCVLRQMHVDALSSVLRKTRVEKDACGERRVLERCVLRETR